MGFYWSYTYALTLVAHSYALLPQYMALLSSNFALYDLSLEVLSPKTKCVMHWQGRS